MRLRRHRDEGGSRADEAVGPWLVVGLGNPGPGYAGTRHNVGYLVVDVLAERMSGTWRRHRTGRADSVAGRLGTPGVAGQSVPVVLMRPRSYMNESGGPVAAVAGYHSVDAAHIVVAHDELDIPYGTLRFKLGGGDNGHNGLRSIRRALGTGEFHRVRVGIGRPPGRQSPVDFVLSGWTSTQRRELPLHVERAADGVESLLFRGLSSTQSDFH